jgi:hypothetical protein
MRILEFAQICRSQGRTVACGLRTVTQPSSKCVSPHSLVGC